MPAIRHPLDVSSSLESVAKGKLKNVFKIALMPELEFSPVAQHWVNVVLIWTGFGTLAGLLAVMILPMRQTSSPVVTLFLGIVGSLIGLLGLSWLLKGQQFNPISPLGFLAAFIGAFLLLIIFRACSACFVKNDEG